eukprot:TRINITY_DN7547_c0_g1_i1.p1 TRINITY_DN7547_c0_g1~~TRINITY_DN7547_c0_g1_i1.p1  ORF type:complete len:422 (-),score=68.86 TRINITY_DN7547_c0_g1_i1:325-1536(-)
MAAPTGMMQIRGGIQMKRNQYLAGFRPDRVASYPTVPRPDINCPFTLDGTIDDVASSNPELAPVLYNDVKTCAQCGKPCAFTMVNCNSCGASLREVPIGKSENVFTAFLFGVRLAKRGFPYVISLRRETDDVLIGDDLLQLTPCHLNGIPKKYYIPDWRFLLPAPQESLKLLELLEAELWEATKPFLQNEGFRKEIFREGVTDEDIRRNIICSFNFPPSQFQLHLQWLVPPLVPFQHFMAETRNHFHEGRGFPLSYVRKILELNQPYSVQKNTPIEEIMEHYAKLGVDYKEHWTEWYDKICLASTLGFQNWNHEDFQYVVEDGKAYEFSVEDGMVKLGAEAAGADPSKLQSADKMVLQNYGRPYSEDGKTSGTYIQKPLKTCIGDGGYQLWHGTDLETLNASL